MATMIRLILIGVWAACIASAASFGASYWSANRTLVSPDAHAAPGLELKKTKTLNVPMVANGEVQGYIVAQFAYTADANTLKAQTVPPDVYLMDEAFREIYASSNLDFRRLEKYDLTGLAKTLVERMKKRLGADVVRDVLVQDFNYVSRADIRK